MQGPDHQGQSAGPPTNQGHHPTEALTRNPGPGAVRFNLGGDLEEITTSVPTFGELKARQEEVEEMRSRLGQWHKVQRGKKQKPTRFVTSWCACECPKCETGKDQHSSPTQGKEVFSLEKITPGAENNLCAVQSTRQIKLTVDSGACDHVIPPHLVSQPINKNTPAVKSGLAHSSASGHRLPNLGEVKVQGEVADAPNEGGIELTMQVAQVKNPLASVKKMCAAGNRLRLKLLCTP